MLVLLHRRTGTAGPHLRSVPQQRPHACRTPPNDPIRTARPTMSKHSRHAALRDALTAIREDADWIAECRNIIGVHNRAKRIRATAGHAETLIASPISDRYDRLLERAYDGGADVRLRAARKHHPRWRHVAWLPVEHAAIAALHAIRWLHRGRRLP